MAPIVCWPWGRSWQRKIRLGSYLSGVPRPMGKTDMDWMMGAEVIFTHATVTKGTSRGEWLRSDLYLWGLPAS